MGRRPTVEVCKDCYLKSEWIDKGLRYKSKQCPNPDTDDLFFMIRKKWLTLVKVVDQVEHAARNKCLEHSRGLRLIDL